MKNSKHWKKVAVFLTCAVVLGSTFVVAGCGEVDGTNSSSSQNETELPSENGGGATLPNTDGWHEERSGYKFCGYYEDKDFTKPVTEKVTEATAKNYHAKYQIDKVQQIACTPTELQDIIYATNFESALKMYFSEILAIYDKSVINRTLDYGVYGIPYSTPDIYFGNVENGLYEMVDTSETVPYDYRNIIIPHYMKYGTRIYNSETGQFEQKLYTRNNKWKVYIGGERYGVQDGWLYGIVDDFAVVYGLYSASDDDIIEYAESLTIPSQVNGYPVKEVSIASFVSVGDEDKGYLPAVGKLTVPSSVENIRMVGAVLENGYLIDELVIEEGVKTVRLNAYAAKKVSLPKSAHYVDFSLIADETYHQNWLMEQSVTVADGGHYYTKDGCLYSKEGDLCFQFAKRNEIELKIDDTAKRVLPLSLVGGCKNIYIPESMEYFDWHAFFYGARHSWFTATSMQRDLLVPLFFVDSQKVAETMLTETAHDWGYKLPVMLFKDTYSLDNCLQGIWEMLSTDGTLDSQLEGATPEEAEQMRQAMRETLFSAIRDSGVTGYKENAHMGNSLAVQGNEVYRAVYDEQYNTVLRVYTYLNTPVENVANFDFDSVLALYAQTQEA